MTTNKPPVTPKDSAVSTVLVSLLGVVVTLAGSLVFKSFNNGAILERTENKLDTAAALCTINGLPINIKDPELSLLTVVIEKKDGSRETFTVDPKRYADLKGETKTEAPTTSDKVK